MKQDIETAATQIEAWLTTMHSKESTSVPGRTVMPKPGTQQPLMKSFAKKGAGSSAAPLELGSTLAEGGMGVVKFAKQKALGRTVVVKTMRGDYEIAAAEDILREAWATGALEHPNIVPVHDVRVGEDGTPVIVLKRIEGDSWTKLMHDSELLRERFGVRDVLDWNLNVLTQVCQAVRFAHSRNILHRDLKPDNVMIGAFGEVYLVDWGIALSLSEQAPDCPLASAQDQSTMAGTPCYMAPEMLGGAPLDARTDIYLMGALLFEILAQRPPHRTTSLADIMEDIQKSKPDIPASAPPGLATIVRKAMAAKPDDRFDDGDDFADALQFFQQTRGSQLLAEEADGHLLRLRELLADEESDTQKLHRCFGALRFGYETAIDAWPENDTALRKLNDARLMMAEYELGRGHAPAAQGLYQEVEDAPAELGERIQVALAKREKEQLELARFRDDADWRLGMRTRIALTWMLGSVWTALPLCVHFLPEYLPKITYPNMFYSTLALALLSVSGWFWARDSMSKSDLNRRISRLLLTLFPTQFLLFLGTSMMGLSTLHGELLMIFLWATLLGAAVATIDRRFLLLTTFVGCAFLFSVRYPELRYIAMSAANGALVLTAVYLWRREGGAKT